MSGTGTSRRPPKNNPLQEAFAKYEAQKGIPSEDALFEIMSTVPELESKSQRLLFWSLSTPGDISNQKKLSSELAAQKWATKGDVFWLRHLLPQAYIQEMIKSWALAGTTPGTPSQLNEIFWERASKAFSRCAKGVVYVILTGPCTDGDKFPVPEDYWAKYEWPILTGAQGNNNEVTEIRRYEADGPWDEENNCYTKYAVIWTKTGGVVEKPVDVGG
ncbi:hypothetical protein DV737_g618, partial [Chaetothyriales sp. CBS 132003]